MSENKTNSSNQQPASNPTKSTVIVPPVTVGRRDGGSKNNIKKRGK